MVFIKGVYHKSGHARFDKCGKCGRPFVEGEEIWKKSRSPGSKILPKTLAYYCKKCYEGLFIDV